MLTLSEVTGYHILFEQLKHLAADSILGLMAQYREDDSPRKVDLGVGVFRDLQGNTPVLSSVLRAEQAVLAAQTTKSYVAAAGREEFNVAVEELVLGALHPARRERRARTVQATGGCGALRVGAELIRATARPATVHVSDPTWGNHVPLLGSSGLRLERYPYYDGAARRVSFDAMLERLERAAPGDVVLIHGCCHNPTGADLDLGQWQTLSQLLSRRRLVPFLDLAYQGFGEDLQADVAGIRLIAEQAPEALIAVSFSKNLGLYRERVGALIMMGGNSSQADAMSSHVLQIARGIYSMPPDHGAAIASRIFADGALRSAWILELAAMRSRIVEMRGLLAQALRAASGGGTFDFIAAQRGMFSLLGVSAKTVDRLRDRHHIYMMQDSRINLAGITPHNAEYVAASVVAELGRE